MLTVPNTSNIIYRQKQTAEYQGNNQHARLYFTSVFVKNNSRCLYVFPGAHCKSTNVSIKNALP